MCVCICVCVYVCVYVCFSVTGDLPFVRSGRQRRVCIRVFLPDRRSAIYAVW